MSSREQEEVQALCRRVKFYRRLLELSSRQRELLEGPKWEEEEIEALERLLDAREEIISVLRAEAGQGEVAGAEVSAAAGVSETAAASGVPVTSWIAAASVTPRVSEVAGVVPGLEKETEKGNKSGQDKRQDKRSLLELEQELKKLQAFLQEQDREVLSLMKSRWQEIGARLKDIRERKRAARAYGEIRRGGEGVFLDYRR